MQFLCFFIIINGPPIGLMEKNESVQDAHEKRGKSIYFYQDLFFFVHEEWLLFSYFECAIMKKHDKFLHKTCKFIP